MGRWFCLTSWQLVSNLFQQHLRNLWRASLWPTFKPSCDHLNQLHLFAFNHSIPVRHTAINMSRNETVCSETLAYVCKGPSWNTHLFTAASKCNFPALHLVKNSTPAFHQQDSDNATNMIIGWYEVPIGSPGKVVKLVFSGSLLSSGGFALWWGLVR